VTAFLQFAATGLASGFVVALLALSVVMIYRSTRVLSFAQGAIASLSTYVYFQLATVWGLPAALALPLAIGASILIGGLSDLAVMRPLRRADTLTRTVSTLGLVLVLQVVMRVVWGGNESFVKPLTSRQVTVGSFSVGGQELITALVAVAAAVALVAWTRRTYSGLGLSAMAEDPVAARLLGVSPERVSRVTWGLSAVLAGLAGILVTPLLVLNPWQMTLIMVTSYGAALLGGFMSLPLALAGGLLIGVVQSEVTGYVTVSGVSEAVGFIAVFAVLLATRGRRGVASQLLERGAQTW
jgi:sulfate-transporting ATPase